MAQVGSHQKISATEGGFTGALDDNDGFGRSAAPLGDLDGDGLIEVAVGAHLDDDGVYSGSNRGAVWILSLNADGTVSAHQKISDTEGGLDSHLSETGYFGASLAPLGDLDEDGVVDLAVGAPNDRDGGYDYGAVWILFLNDDGTVKGEQKISATEGGFEGPLEDDKFGSSVAGLGDLDGDGVPDLAVGARNDDDGLSYNGAVWILFLNADGTVKSEQKISATAGGFTGTLDDNDKFGSSVAALGDLDGDGATDLAVGAPDDTDGGFDRGAMWILFLNTDGTVDSHQKISSTEGGFDGTIDDFDYFGSAASALGDLDSNGTTDLAVGVPNDSDGGWQRGAVWLIYLNADGTVKREAKISDTEGGFTGTLADNDQFGSSVAPLGDLDDDGVPDLAVGAIWDDDGGSQRGAVWVLFGEPSILPVELTAFEALARDGGVALRWKTASETNNSGFAVERSVGGAAFRQIGFVEGAGTTDRPQHYRFSDAELPYIVDHVAYRLKQVDADGAFTYSDEVELAIEAPDRLALHPSFPNPFRGQTTIRYAVPGAGPAELAVYDLQGRRVALLARGEQAAGRKEVTFDASQLASGTYLVRLVANGQMRIRRLTVVK